MSPVAVAHNVGVYLAAVVDAVHRACEDTIIGAVTGQRHALSADAWDDDIGTDGLLGAEARRLREDVGQLLHDQLENNQWMESMRFAGTNGQSSPASLSSSRPSLQQPAPTAVMVSRLLYKGLAWTTTFVGGSAAVASRGAWNQFSVCSGKATRWGVLLRM